MTQPFTSTRVRFQSEGDRLVGNLHTPVHHDSDSIIVVTGSWTTVKEQQAEFYARLLAAEGFTTLTFDFRGFGQSEGAPRSWENPDRKISDIHAAVTYAVEQLGSARIGALGICASSGYQAVNAASDSRVNSLAMIAPWLHNMQLVAPYYGGEAGVQERIAASRAAHARYQETGEVDYIPAISTTDPAAAMYGPYDYYLDPQRGYIPEWDKRIATMSWEPWLTFNPLVSAPQLTIPVHMIHSPEAAVPDGAQQFYDHLPGPKKLRWIEGTQLDFYDQPTQVSHALRTTADHFRNTL